MDYGHHAVDGIEVRSEGPTDWPGIAELHAEAFNHQVQATEVALVDVLRHRSEFSPEFSIVAVHQEEIIGHLLLTVCPLSFGNQVLRGVILAPLAVTPRWQKKGIGSLLVREAHSRAKTSQVACSVLLGHPDYYPRFGYRTKMFGTCGIEVPCVDEMSVSPGSGVPGQSEITERRVISADLGALGEMWDACFEGIDLAPKPAPALREWVSPSRSVSAVSLVREGRLVGYARYQVDSPARLECLLVAKDAASAAVRHFQQKASQAGEDKVILPIHPDSVVASWFGQESGKPVAMAWEAAMVCPLHDPAGMVEAYCQGVTDGTRSIGMMTWPIEFVVS